MKINAKTIDAVYRTLAIYLDRNPRLENALRDGVQASTRGEREHRAFGRRLLGRPPGRRMSTDAAGKGVFLNAMFRALTETPAPTMRELLAFRDDWRIAHMIAGAMAEDERAAVRSILEPLATWDYCVHVARD